MQNVMEVVIVTANDMSALSGRDGEQVALVFRSIGNWLAKMHKRSKPQRFMCLDCDTEFHVRRMPEAFAIPFNEDSQVYGWRLPAGLGADANVRSVCITRPDDRAGAGVRARVSGGACEQRSALRPE